MRRAVSVVVGTIAGVALLLQYKTTPVAKRVLAGPRPTSTTLPTSDDSSRPAGDASPEPGFALPSTSAAPTSTTAAPVTRTTRTTAPRTTTTTAAHVREVMGDDVSTRYGDLQLKVTFDGSRISDITAVRLPSDTRRSEQISGNAEPRLREEALQAQSAQIDTVSGASYTSEGYRESLQSAIDRAGR